MAFLIFSMYGMMRGEPEIEERFDPDRTVLTLSFAKKAMEKSDEKEQRAV